MEAEDALRTVECLRGRLLAERAVSKAANETADIMSTKLKELEEKLKIEEKCRRKAEKKLNILKKKLESLKLGFRICEESDECSSTVFSTDQVSETSSGSISSTASFSTGLRSDPGDHIPPRSIDCSNSCSPKIANNADQGERIEADSKMENGQEYSVKHSGLNPSELEEKRSKEDDQREDDDQHDDDYSMALVLSVPVESSENPCNREIKANNERVREVLDALKQIRENIKSTMDRRRIIQVG